MHFAPPNGRWCVVSGRYAPPNRPLHSAICTVEEINFMCVFETQDRTDMIGQIRQIMPHIKDSDMEELGEQVLGKLQSITDEEFAEISLEAAEKNN